MPPYDGEGRMRAVRRPESASPNYALRDSPVVDGCRWLSVAEAVNSLREHWLALSAGRWGTDPLPLSGPVVAAAPYPDSDRPVVEGQVIALREAERRGPAARSALLVNNCR